MTARLIVTVGLPASGKTTRARAWVAEDSCCRVRVNRDDLRDMLFGGWTGQAEHEIAATVAQHAQVRALLVAGYDVVVDDTNLRPEFVSALRFVADRAGAAVEVWDMTDVPENVCIERDAERRQRGERSVGEAVIRRMAAQMRGGHEQEGPTP